MCYSFSLVDVFFCLSLALMVANLLETVFITNLHFHSSHYGAVPRWLRILVLQYLAVFVGLRPVQANRVTVSLPDQAQGIKPSSFVPIGGVLCDKYYQGPACFSRMTNYWIGDSQQQSPPASSPQESSTESLVIYLQRSLQIMPWRNSES